MRALYMHDCNNVEARGMSHRTGNLCETLTLHRKAVIRKKSGAMASCNVRFGERRNQASG